jgi:energy-coupling factor transporter ATP-binding protein EcfA2
MKENEEKPYFIIVAGPTASGKSTLVNKIAKYINNENLLNSKKTKFISVDNYIEKNPYFQEEINNFLKKKFKNNKQKIYNEFLVPSKKTIIYFNKLYWDTRKNKDCLTGKNINLKNKTVRETKYKTCGQLIANNILYELKNNNNIIFETTGTSFPFWIFKQFTNFLSNYNVIISWSVVDICDLYNRNKFRTLSTIKTFIETFADSAPRLPDIRKKNYKRNLIAIIETYKELVKYHGNRSLSKLRLLLFDNRDKKNRILYDSYKNSDKTGYKEILKYNIHNSCDKKTPKTSPYRETKSAKLSLSPRNNSSAKLSLSPRNNSSAKLSLSPRESASNVQKLSLSPRESASNVQKLSLSPRESSYNITNSKKGYNTRSKKTRRHN